MPRHKPPSRLRYEAEHPSLTVRIPAEVKAKVLAAARAEGLSVSEWVQALADGRVAEAAAAYRRGEEAGREQGEAAGHQRGRTEGEQVAGTAGFRAGVLVCTFAVEDGRHYDPATIASRLLQHPDQRAIAERLVPPAYQRGLARLMQAAEQGRAPASTG